jgi:hypothetical protein
MATSLYQFLPQVLPEVQGCPDVMAIEAVRNAAIDLCERAQCIETTLDPIDVIATINQYDIVCDDGLYPQHVKSCTFNGVPLTPKTVAQLDEGLVAYDSTAGGVVGTVATGWRTVQGTPQYFFRPTDLTLQLVLTPSTTYLASLYLTLNTVPTRNCTTLDDQLYQRYYGLIAVGAKSKLMMIQKQSWSNLDQGAKFAGQFNDMINGVLGSNLQGQNNVQLRARAPFKFA